MSDISRDEFYRAFDGLRELTLTGLGRVEGQLLTINGRLRKSEQDIAVMQDRTEQSKHDGVRNNRKWTGIGAAVSALIAGAISYFK